MTRRVLLASLNAGGGHNALRDSFASALARVDPDQKQFERVTSFFQRTVRRAFTPHTCEAPGL